MVGSPSPTICTLVPILSTRRNIDLRPRARAMGRAVSPWLALIFAAVALLYVLAPPVDPALPLALSSALASACMLLGWIAIDRVPEAAVHAVMTALSLVGVGFALAFVGFTDDPAQSVVLIIILLGAACVLVEPVPILLVVAAALGGWGVVAADFDDHTRLHWQINLVSSSLLAVLVSWARARTLGQLERERRGLESAHDALADQAGELEVARDQALESARVKSEFLARMSHELRTPLGGIIGLSDLVLEGNLDDDQRDYVRTARDSAEGLLAIIDDLLDMGRLDAGRVALRVDTVVVRDLVGECVRLLEPRVSGRSLRLATRIAPEVPQSVMADPHLLRRVLINLVANSIKFTEHGGVEVDVERAGPGALSFAVRDTGVGIAAADQERVWDPFVQVDASASRAYGGVGLGLAICRGLVELMGGSIELESEPGRGTTVRFEVPVEVIERAGEVSASAG